MSLTLTIPSGQSSGLSFSACGAFSESVLKEMADALALDLVDKSVLTNRLTLAVGYDIGSLDSSKLDSCADYAMKRAAERAAKSYQGPVTIEHPLHRRSAGWRPLRRGSGEIPDPKPQICRHPNASQHWLSPQDIEKRRENRTAAWSFAGNAKWRMRSSFRSKRHREIDQHETLGIGRRNL